MPFVVSTKLEGVSAAVARFDKIDNDLRYRIAREAVDDAAKIVLRKAKALAPVRTGQLRRSLAVRMRSYASGKILAVIGPEKGHRVMRRIGRKMKPVNPIYYAHLIEGGFRIVKGGKLKSGGRVVGRVAPNPFMRRAAQQSENAVIAAISKRIAAEVKRMGL